MNGAALEAVVGFCYTGVVEGVCGDTVAAMLHASHRLQLDPMTEVSQNIRLVSGSTQMKSNQLCSSNCHTCM